MCLTKVHRVKTRCRYWPGRYGTRRICEFQTISASASIIFFLQPAHQHFNCNISRNDGKKKRDCLTNGGATSAVTRCLNIELKMEQYQGPHVRAINIHRPPTGGKSWLGPVPRRNLLFSTKSQKCVAAGLLLPSSWISV